jgi:hypothetical protein
MMNQTGRARLRAGVGLGGWVALAAVLSCQDKAAAPPASVANVESCDVLVPRWIERLQAAPDVTTPKRSRADLPVASLAGVIGEGAWVEIRPDAVTLEGEALPGANEAERIRALEARLASESGAAPEGAPESKPVPLYLSVAAMTDVRTLRQYVNAIPRTFDVQLVFQTPSEDTAGGPAPELERLALETDPTARRQLARAAYARATRCGPMLDALSNVTDTAPAARWKSLRAALIDTLPECDCHDVDPRIMRDLLVAERSGGAVGLGSLPLDFIRDERCGASLGLSPLQNVVKDIQHFDEKYSNVQQGDELVFESVLTRDKLIAYVCQALPGETLAALQREGRTFFWRVPGVDQCQAWRFEPVEPGSPVGIWRQQPADGKAPVAVHYVQGAEEIRLSGPISPESPGSGEAHDWACTQDFHMRGVDQNSIELEEGRWYFDAEACQRAQPEAAEFPGCIAALASGVEEPAPGAPKRR